MIKVKATDKSKLMNKAITELMRIAEPGEVFEVTEERFKVLNGANRHKVAFVEKAECCGCKKIEEVKVEPVKEVITPKEEPVVEPAVEEFNGVLVEDSLEYTIEDLPEGELLEDLVVDDIILDEELNG